MRLTVWGCRGSIACPGAGTVRYGGNTTCYEVRSDAGDLLILDAGTGLRELGMRLMKEMPIKAHIVFSHTHYDHVMGYPFFVPFFVPGNEFWIHGPVHFERSFQSVMTEQMDYSFFPVRMQELAATLHFLDTREEELEMGPFKVRTMYANHPIATIAYRVEAGGRTLVFTGDTEPYQNYLEGVPGADKDELADIAAMIEEQKLRWKDFLSGADLCLYDAQYTPEEYPKFKGWGHTPMDIAIENSAAAGVKRLLMTHHNPTRKDEDLDTLSLRWAGYAKEKGLAIETAFAAEGRSYEL